MARKKDDDGLVALSEVWHDGEKVLDHGEKVTDAKVKDLGADVMNELYDTGVVVEQNLLPEYWKDRPEGNTDRTGFRVPDISEMAARNAALAAKESAGQATEVSS